MQLTVQGVVDNPALRTRLLAGAGGLGRHLTWAHSIEVPEPWGWMGNGELLMTTGQNFPSDPQGQVHFISQLDAGGISGLALGARMAAPLTREAAAVADRLGFPILETAYAVPFVLVARAVAESSTRDAQLTKILRVYELYRKSSVQSLTDDETLDRLSTEVGAQLRIVTVGTWETLVPVASGDSAPDPALLDLPSRLPLPAVTRVKSGTTDVLVLPIGDGTRYALLAEVTTATFDLVVLQHVSTIASVQAERRVAELTTRLSRSGRLFAQLVDGSLDSESARSMLSNLGLKRGPWLTGALVTPEPVDLLRLQQRLRRIGVATLVGEVRQRTMVFFPAAAKRKVIPLLEQSSGEEGRIGISDAVHRFTGVADSVREALWASQAARADGAKTAWYGVDRPLFLPGTVTEAREVVTQVLGVLIDYDHEHGSDLMGSLQVYFDQKRSWQAASQQLSIHRQTLVYRMKRVEQLTGRSLNDLDDLSELNLALRTRRFMIREIAPLTNHD